MDNFVHLKRTHEALKNEFQICRRKLDSKCEALLILTKDLDQCRQERDQFKLMAEQVQERYQGLKRQLAGIGPREPLDMELREKSSQSLAHLLCEMREVNKALQFEADDYKQKLQDAQGDIKLLREQIARQRVGTTDEGINTRHFPAHEREDLVTQLEACKDEFSQLERDLQQVLDEKEELVTERDVYKNKYDRLNTELNYILKGDEKRIVDIDALVMENKYLKDRLKQMEEEKYIAMATVSKYKSILEKRKTKGGSKLGQMRPGSVVVTQRQVQQLLESKTQLSPTPQMVADLQSLASALLETVKDKNLALSHQRKTNKILGNRVSELENKLKTLEVSGLWSLPEPGLSPCLEKLKEECAEIKTLLPSRPIKPDKEPCMDKSLLDSLEPDSSSEPPSPNTSPVHQPIQVRTKPIMEDLDLLPTRDQGHGISQGHGDSKTEAPQQQRDSKACGDDAVAAAGDMGDMMASPLLSPCSETFTEDSNSLDLHDDLHDSSDLESLAEVDAKLSSLVEAAANKVSEQLRKHSNDPNNTSISEASSDRSESSQSTETPKRTEEIIEDHDDDDDDEDDDLSEDERLERSLLSSDFLEGNQKC